MINKVTLIGNLGKDPEVKRLESGSVMARFSLATSESYKDQSGNWQEKTQWHNVVAWRNGAEYAEKHLQKGTTVYLEGKIEYREYEKDGQKRYATDIIVDRLRALANKRESGNGANGQYQQPPQGYPQQYPPQPQGWPTQSPPPPPQGYPMPQGYPQAPPPQNAPQPQGYPQQYPPQQPQAKGGGKNDDDDLPF